MIAQAVNLMNFLKGPKQFIIPIYQRTYSWTMKECGQLWDDIVKTGGGGKCLFVMPRGKDFGAIKAKMG
jgi:hypothetical protein